MNSSLHLPTLLREALRLTERDVSSIQSALTLRSLRKGERLLVPGQVCAMFGVVARGCLRVYFSEPDGTERVVYFAPEGWCVTDHESLASQRPGTLGIDALESTDVWVMKREAFRDSTLEHRSWERVWSALTDQALRAFQRRLINALLKTAAHRYMDFRRMYPGLDSRISQYHIAAYLAVSPEFLSKLRTRLIRNRHD